MALIAGLNYLGTRYKKSWDVTEASVYTLSPQSKKVAEALKDKLVLTAFSDGGANPQLQTVLDGYRDAAPGQVETRMLDPDKEPALAEQMKITTVPSVHIQYGKESFVVTQPTEETITNGVIRVTRPGKKVVYFTEGFGEASLSDPQDPKGFASAKLALEQENYEVKPLLLPSVEQVPDDASVVVLAGPTRPLTEPAITALEAYLKRGGRLLALVGRASAARSFSCPPAGWGGVKVGGDIVIDREVRLPEALPRRRLLSRPTARTRSRRASATSRPIRRRSSVGARGRGQVRGIQATALVKTSESSWAETNVDGVLVQGTASPTTPTARARCRSRWRSPPT